MFQLLKVPVEDVEENQPERNGYDRAGQILKDRVLNGIEFQAAKGEKNFFV